MNATTTTTDRDAVLSGLDRFIAQRSGIDWRDYYSDGRDTAGVEACRDDYRTVLRDGKQARKLLAFVRRASIDTAVIVEACRHSRLTLADDGSRWDFVTCQYFVTEYRAAACLVLSAAIWHYWRECGYDADGIRKQARREFGPAIARRWFA